MSLTQLMKGILDGCLLALIAGKEVYGYEMAERLSECEFDSVREGTIYPLRMQRKELVPLSERNLQTDQRESIIP